MECGVRIVLRYSIHVSNHLFLKSYLTPHSTLHKRLKDMSEKKTKNFILRIDSDTMDAIEAWAADEFRSTNGQLQWIITEALRKAKRLPKKKTSNSDEVKEGNEK